MVSCPHLLAIDLKKNWTLWYWELFKRSEFILEDVAFCDPSLFTYRETAHSFLLLLNYQRAVVSVHEHIHFSLHIYTTVTLGTMPTVGTHGDTHLQTNKLLSQIIVSLLVTPTNTDCVFWLLDDYFPWNFIISFVWVFWGLKRSWISPRWFVFACTSCLGIRPIWVNWRFSDHLGSEIWTIHDCEWWLCYKSSGEIFGLYFHSMESFP